MSQTLSLILTVGSLFLGVLCGCTDLNTPPVKSNQKPIAELIAHPKGGSAPLTVGFDGGASKDTDGKIEMYIFIFGDGADSTTTTNLTHYTYVDTGSYRPGLLVQDDQGVRSDTTWLQENILVGIAPNRIPVALFAVNPKSGYAPLTVTANGSASYDPDGTIDKRFWDYENDGVIDDSSNVTVTPTYATPGSYTLSHFVRDNEGAVSPKNLVTIVVTEQPDQIAYWNSDDNIYRADFVTTTAGRDTLVNIVRLTSDPGQDFGPAWSPDGKYILFTSHRTGGTSVWKMDENGNGQVDVSSHLVERAREADWGSSGKIVVAYRDKNDSEAGIGIIDPVADTFTPIYSEPSTSRIPTKPEWSPDGTKIVFTKNVGNDEIYIMNADGTELENLSNNSAHDNLPSWSPNGSEILFKSNRYGSSDILVMNADGSNLTRITDNTEVETDPVWSDDGEKIIFVHDLTSFFSPQLYSMNADGTNWVKLTFNGANRYPAFRPKP